MTGFLIYGSYGYTGRLIAKHAVSIGLRPVLAGRNGNRLKQQANALGLDHRCFSLEDTSALDDALTGVKAVLHCAGPFTNTCLPMVQACLRARRHYVDISGDLDGFEQLVALDDQAKQARIMLLPGAGMDVVPTDCLSAHLGMRFKNATHLKIFISNVHGGISRGTARSAVSRMDRPGFIREAGIITAVPSAWRVLDADFGKHKRRVVSIGWGDVSTAFYSTGIPNIETYMALPPTVIRFMRISRILGPLVTNHFVKKLINGLVGWVLPPGPSEWQNNEGYTLIIAEISDGNEIHRARLRTPAPYRLTVLTSVEIMKRILSSDFKPGFQTPSLAYEPDFIMQFPGVTRDDLIE